MARSPGDPRRAALELGLAFAVHRDVKDLMAFAVAECCKLLDVESVAVLLLDETGDELYFPYVAEPNPVIARRLMGIRFSAERGVAGAVLRDGKALQVDDVAADSRFLGAVDELTGRTTRAILAAPLASEGRKLGVIEAVNPRGGGGFRDDDLGLLEVLARELSIAIARTGIGAPVQSLGADGPAPDKVFRREGDYWTICFRRHTFRVRHCAGLSYIARLLRHPGRDFHAAELLGLERDPGPELRGLPSADTGPALDGRARREYARRIAELREELEEACQMNDMGRAERTREELDALTTELQHAAGLGTARRTGSLAERARVNVTRSIGIAVKRIAAHEAALADYLAKTIKTGTFCRYYPGSDVCDWQL